MAVSKHTTPEATALTEDELHVAMCAEFSIGIFQGTRKALEVEGIVPGTISWPDGSEFVTWEANGLRFRLNRARRFELRQWHNPTQRSDVWHLRTDPVEKASYPELEIRRKREELRRLITSASPAGWAESQRLWRRREAAASDEAFQRLLRVVLPKPKPRAKAGPKPKMRNDADAGVRHD